MKDNSIAIILRFIGFLTIVLGIIFSFDLTDNFGGSLALITGFYSFISGMLFIGFGEVVRILHEMNQRSKEQNMLPVAETTTQTDTTPTSPIRNDQIEEFYSDKGLYVDAIYEAPGDDMYFVKVKDKTQLVELGGFSPVIIPQAKWSESVKVAYQDMK
ncbi:hypothetical protein ACFSCX_23190 [Bacillus salitolerans]|uniref:Uncharacterized protein n=1 Tax=Bacillus salitolerans TaxID=1437434 RepID=A0ABW4LYA6_9BACI